MRVNMVRVVDMLHQRSVLNTMHRCSATTVVRNACDKLQFAVYKCALFTKLYYFVSPSSSQAISHVIQHF